MVVLSRFMYSLQPDCAAYVRSQVPKTAREATRLATEYDRLIGMKTPESDRSRQGGGKY